QDELDEDFELARTGSLYACDTDQEMQVAADYAKSMRDDGYDIRTLDPKELLEFEPYIAKDLKGGLYSPESIGLNPYRLCFAFVDQVEGKGLDVYRHTAVKGIKLGKNNEVESVEIDGGELATANVVNCAGVWAPEIGKMVGIEIPIIPRKGVILVSTGSFPFNFRKVQEFGYMISKFSNFECKRDPELEKYGVSFTIEPTEANNVLVGSSRNFAGYGVNTEIEIIHTIAKRAIRFYPILKDTLCIRSYAGVRPFMEDHLPLITDVEKVPGYYIAAGHEGDGISMSPATGRLIAEMITGEPLFINQTPFSYKRYDGRL
ncbi:MAG: FAD-dependent oxidoreductase, partial [Eubacteriales bacterium]|nr:FAD-dependent oxidoreductase [Eubacteriales bacterium]